jgi:hypothetical protein
MFNQERVGWRSRHKNKKYITESQLRVCIENLQGHDSLGQDEHDRKKYRAFA